MKINPPKWTTEEDSIIEELSATLSGSELFSAISEKTGRTKNACQIRATKKRMLGPNVRASFGRKAWTKQEDQWLAEHIRATGSRDWLDSAAASLQRRRNSVQSRASILGISYKKEFNEDYFSNWTHESAYAGGYIWADGSIENCEKRSAYRLRLRCSPCDDYLIFDIAKRIGGYKVQKPVPPKTQKTTMNKSGEVKSNGLTSISISGKVFVDNLHRVFGVVPNKSGVNPEYASVPDEFFGSFMRGVFDGDGSVGLNKKLACNSVVIYGSDKFLVGLAAQASRVLGIRNPPLARNRNLGKISWNSFSDISKIYKSFYDNHSWTWLERKRQKMHTSISWIELKNRYPQEADNRTKKVR